MSHRSSQTFLRELEEHDYYIKMNVFWVLSLARWKTLQDSGNLITTMLFQRTDFVMAHLPFNIKEWWYGKLERDACWT